MAEREVRIRDSGALKGWLLRSHSSWAQAIATRLALRTAPFAETVRYPVEGPLTLFRANHVAWVSRKYPTHVVAASAASAALAASTAARGASTIDIAAARAIEASASAASASASVSASATTDEAAAAARAAYSAAYSRAPIDAIEIWESIESDLNFLEGMLPRSTRTNRADASLEIRTAQRLIAEPLWLGKSGPPIWALDAFDRFVSSSILRKDGFDIWFDWYRALLPFERDARARSFFGEKIDLRIADQPKEWWDRPPAEVNAEIREWLEAAYETPTEPMPDPDLSDIPLQDPLAVIMAVNADGKVDTARIEDQTRLLDTPDQRSDYADIVADARALRSLGDNLLGKLAGELDQLLAVMPDDFSRATVRPVWRAGNRLRRTYNAHRAVVDLAEPQHFAGVDPAVAVELEALLATLNNFFFTDPALRARDERRIPPQDRIAAEIERAQIAPVVGDVLEDEDISTQRARDEVRREDENAETVGSDEHSAQALDQANRTVRNFIAAAISGAFQAGKKIVAACGREAGVAWSSVREGVYTAAGGVVFTELVGLTTFHKALIDFVVRHAETLRMYVVQAYQNPAVQQVIDWLVQVFG